MAKTEGQKQGKKCAVVLNYDGFWWKMQCAT